jgi:hypothetical protein
MSEPLLLYPRLAAPTAIAQLRSWLGLSVSEVRQEADSWQPRTSFYEIGEHVTADRLERLAVTLRKIAADSGYPNVRKRTGLSSFDRAAGLRLLEEPILDVGAEDVWCNLTTSLVPDIVLWRWGWPSTANRTPEEIPARAFERFLGGFRNTLRRNWCRLSWYGDGTADPPATFWEDALVSVEERPAIGSDPRVARAIFSAAEPLRAVEPYEKREDLFRGLARETCELAGWRELSTLNDGDLTALLDQVVDDVRIGQVQNVLKIYMRYQRVRTDGYFHVDTHEVEIASGALAGWVYSSPSAAARAVVEEANPKVNSARNGWRTWLLADTEEELRSVR